MAEQSVSNRSLKLLYVHIVLQILKNMANRTIFKSEAIMIFQVAHGKEGVVVFVLT